MKLILNDYKVVAKGGLSVIELEWNESDVSVIYTKNGSSPLDDSSPTIINSSNLVVDRTTVIRLLGIKVGYQPSDEYLISVVNQNPLPTSTRSFVSDIRFSEPRSRSSLYSTSPELRLHSGLLIRSRYIPPDYSLDGTDDYKIIEVTGDYKDRLDLIAYDYLGNSEYWWMIAELNRSIIIDPINVPVGTKLIIPSSTLLYKSGTLLMDTKDITDNIYSRTK